MRTCKFGMILAVLIMAVVAVGNSSVSAADPCVVQLSSSATMTKYYNSYNSYIGVILPLSATCSFFGGQLYAVGSATDTSTNAAVGSANTALVSAYGVATYTGQLVFSLPRTVAGHALQFSVSIYSGAYGPYSTGSPLATTVGTAQVNPDNNFINYGDCYYTNSCNYNYNYCSTSSDGTTKCLGYLYQDASGCVQLVIPVYSSIGSVSYQYYTLQKLPSSYPALGTWVTVTGQLNQGYNYAPNGTSGCPGNYIIVSSISN